MTIYVEDLFFENFIIFLSMAFFTTSLLGKKEKFVKAVFASIFAACFECAGVMVGLGKYGHIMLLAFNVGLVVLMSQKGTKSIFVSIIISFAYLFVIDGLRGLLAKYINISSWIKIFGLVYVLLMFKLIKHFYNIKKHKKFEYKVNFYNGQNVFSTIAYLDSGNFLQDSISQKPVVIIDYNAFLHISGVPFDDFLHGKFDLKNSHYIDCSTISGNKKMLVFEIDYIEIDGKRVDCLLGLNLNGFENGYSALLGVQVLGDMI